MDKFLHLCARWPVVLCLARSFRPVAAVAGFWLAVMLAVPLRAGRAAIWRPGNDRFRGQSSVGQHGPDTLDRVFHPSPGRHLQPQAARNVIDPRGVQRHAPGVYRGNQRARALPVRAGVFARRQQILEPAQQVQGASPLPQAAHRQALPRACSGMRDSKLASNLAWVHQHGACLTPVARSTSIAHWFCCPHSGHRLGSTGRATCMGGSSAGNFNEQAV